jgi:hypothetical protein
MLANTTLLFAFAYLFDSLKKEGSEENKFMLGLWLAVSGLLYTPYLVLLLFGLIGLSILKTVRMKEIFQYVTGYITPFFVGWMLLIISTGHLVAPDLSMLRDVGLPALDAFNHESDILALTITGLLLLVSLLGYSQMVARKNIHAQKKIDTLYTFLFFCALMAFFQPVLTLPFLIVLWIPLSLFMANFILQVRLAAIAESIHFILVVMAWLTQVLWVM